MSSNTEKRNADLDQRSEELDRELSVIQDKAGQLANLRGVSFIGVLAFVILFFSREEKLVFG